MANKKFESEGFLVDTWEKIFRILGKISIFYLIRKLEEDRKDKNAPNKIITHNFVDGWVLGNLILSIISSIFVYYFEERNLIVFYSIAIYGVLRVFEIIVYQINVMLFDPYRAKKKNQVYKVKSVRRIIIALLHNYVEIMFWYSSLLIIFMKLSNSLSGQFWLSIVISSVLCITTFDREVIENLSNVKMQFLSTFAFLEIISGFIMTLISLARFIGILPPVDEID